MPSEVKLEVNTDIAKAIEELAKLVKQAKNADQDIAKMAETSEKAINESTKNVEKHFQTVRSTAGRILDQIKSDFKGLLSLNALQSGLQINQQFRGTIRETVSLSDAIRKVGGSLGVAAKDFDSFQSKLMKGLGEIGLSAEAGAATIAGLAGTPVKGQEQITGYARAAGQLASVGREQGREGDIAKGIAGIIHARGGDVNDMRQVGQVAEDLRRVTAVTGKGPSETIAAMEQMFTNMSEDFRKTIGTRGLANLAATGQVAGPGSTKFLEEFLGKSPIARSALEAQGFKGVFSDKGLDIEKFRAAAGGVVGRVGGDPRMAAQTLGLSEEAAEGFVRLYRSLNEVKKAQDDVNNATGSLTDTYRKNMGLGEAFRANINRIKGVISAPLGYATQGASNLLSKTSESGLGSAGVVAGGGLLAAVLAGGGLRGIGGMLGKGAMGLAKAEAVEQLTGEKVQKVYVVNASEIAGGAGLGEAAGGMLGKAGGMLGKAGKFLGPAGSVLGAGAAGYAVGSTLQAGFEYTGLADKLADAIAKALGPSQAQIDAMAQQQVRPSQKVIIELNKRELKESKQPTRGASVGP